MPLYEASSRLIAQEEIKIFYI